MKNKSTAEYKNFFLRFFFILTALIYLVKAESSLYNTPTDFCYNPIQTVSELVVSAKPEYDLSFYKLEIPPKQTSDFSPAHIDFSSIHKFALIHYNHYVLQQLKSRNRTFTPNHQLTSVLQKHNIWHQSSDEDPLLFG